MGDTMSTRRGVLCSLTGLTAISLLPTTAGTVSSARTRLQPSRTIPTFIPAEEELLSLEEASIGWGVEATSGQSVDTEQVARTATDRATAYATVPTQHTGEFAQTAVIGAPFTVATDQPVDLSIAFDGQYKGALKAGRDSSAAASMVYGVGPYEDVYGAAFGLDASPTFSTATIHERKLFDQAVRDGTAIIRNAIARESIVLSASEPTTYVAYARLWTNGEASAADTTTIDFSPDGPNLIEPTDDQQREQYKGFVLKNVRITA
ncbi:hypothetical protein [Halocatena pleomorpha]|uniref:Uncharacterized protein n=1 Tax=Halocatena pleomorpha TaxID=1785090 RepID=A0A3P3RAU5_9EURY|nr:hypothetical protein [Halocatena pleomorpha]RRJ30505.1 hypothetical protein EIK79_09470 [Halocatena pleomorpha]